MMKIGKYSIPVGITMIIGLLLISGCSLPFTTTAPEVTEVAPEPIFVTPTSPITGPTVIVVTPQPIEEATSTEMVDGVETATPTIDLSITPTGTVSPYLGEHTVQAGETLFAIGRAYVVDPKGIAAENGLVSPYTIYRGDVLKIPPLKWTDVPGGTAAVQQFTPDWEAVGEYAPPAAYNTLIVVPYYPSSH
ncbi:MAG: LysM peptidoglycan-binding domain-containing protein [Anaerolineaceae bacterium]|nr:LysM peptidoglycan-binding domain-containing protein [Anaerolineaceae bacterium]